MPTSSSIVEKHSFAFTWDFEVDTNDPTTKLKLPLQTRFGELALQVAVKKHRAMSLVLLFGSTEAGSLARDVDLAADIFWLDDAGRATSLQGQLMHAAAFPPPTKDMEMVKVSSGDLTIAENRDRSFRPLSHRRFRFVLALPAVIPSRAAQYALPGHQININSSASLHLKRPNDVQLYFSNLDAELWESSSFLSASSPYFKTLLASGDFTESVRRTRKRAKIQEGEEIVLNGDVRAGSRARLNTVSKWNSGDGLGEGDDSDDETDDFIKRRSPPSREDNSDDGDFTYREVHISTTPYSTYRAVLLYLHSGDITFAPLSSTLLPSNPAAKHTHEQLLDRHLAGKPSHPPPVSPKSVYRLAHLLETPSLCALALAELKAQLTTTNAAQELFSSIAVYDDACEVLLDFVVANWKEVKASEGMKQIRRRVGAGELPQAAVTLMELLSMV